MLSERVKAGVIMRVGLTWSTLVLTNVLTQKQGLIPGPSSDEGFVGGITAAKIFIGNYLHNPKYISIE